MKVDLEIGAAAEGGSPRGPALARPLVGNFCQARYEVKTEETKMAAPIRRTANPIQKGKKLGSVKPLSAKTLKSYETLRVY